eukprot:scaffold120746_cov48-Phaeocystis_antarctica.AAC.1
MSSACRPTASASARSSCAASAPSSLSGALPGYHPFPRYHPSLQRRRLPATPRPQLQPKPQPIFMTRYHIYPHRVSPPSGSAAAPPAAPPALGPSGSSSGAAVEPLCTSLDPALEAAFLFGLLQTRALKALQGLLRVESAKTHVLEGGLLPSILASAAMPVPLVGLHQTEVLQTHVAMLEQARSLVTTP